MAGNAGAIRAGRAFVELFADDSKLVRGLKAASGKLKAWGATVTGIGLKTMAAGAAIATPLMAATRVFMTAGDELDKMSYRVGMSVEFLSALGHAAQIGGTSIGALETGLRRMQRTAYDASQGSSTATQAFAELGVSVYDAGGNLKETEQLFMESAAALSAIENNTKKAALATIIFGRAGTQLMPMLERRGELTERMAEAERLGLTLTSETTSAAAELTDAWTRLTSGAKAATIQIGAALAPALQRAADWMEQFIRPTIDWIKANREMIATVFKVAVGVVAAGAAFVAVGTALTVGGMALSGFASAIAMIGSVLGVLITPLGAAVAVIGGLVYWSGAGGKALNWLGEQFEWLSAVASDTWGGIADAIAAGDLALAAEVAWAGVMVVWHTATQRLKGTWAGVKWWFLSIWDEVTHNLAAGWIKMTSILESAWLKVMNAIDSRWTVTQASLAEGFAWIIAKVQGLDPEEVMRYAREDIERQGARRQAGRTDRLAEIERDRAGTLAANEAMREEAAARRQRDYMEAIGAAQQDLDSAEQRLAEARDRASEAREAVEQAAMERAERPDFTGPDFAGAEATTGRGAMTFGAFALGGLGMGGGPAERTAKATEQTVEEVRRMNRTLRDQKLIAAFGS